jgi:hypothetical protein
MDFKRYNVDIVYSWERIIMSAWELYDRLIDGIPSGVQVVDYALGTKWTYLEAECGAGTAWTHPGGAARADRGDLRGRELRDVAALAKSWNFTEATFGIAALNAWYSRRELLEGQDVRFDSDNPAGQVPAVGDAALGKRGGKTDAFDGYRPQIEAMDNPKVVVVGHFPKIERMAEYCELTVLERNPHDGDTPDPACEYVVPEADFLFMTGVTNINKTAPRLLELSRNARTIMVGPSAILSPVYFDFGVEAIAGSVCIDPEALRFAAINGTGELFGRALDMCMYRA